MARMEMPGLLRGGAAKKKAAPKKKKAPPFGANMPPDAAMAQPNPLGMGQSSKGKCPKCGASLGVGAGQSKHACVGKGGDTEGTSVTKPPRGRTEMVRGPGGTVGYDAGDGNAEAAAGKIVSAKNPFKVGMGQSSKKTSKTGFKKAGKSKGRGIAD